MTKGKDMTDQDNSALVKRLKVRRQQPYERANHYVRRLEIERIEAADALTAAQARIEALEVRKSQSKVEECRIDLDGADYRAFAEGFNQHGGLVTIAAYNQGERVRLSDNGADLYNLNILSHKALEAERNAAWNEAIEAAKQLAAEWYHNSGHGSPADEIETLKKGQPT